MQAILGAGAVQGQTNQAFQAISQQDLEDYQRRYGNLVGAQDAMAQEKAKEWGWNVQGKWQDTVATDAAIAQNRANTWKDVSGMGMAGANVSANMAGKGGGGASPQATGSFGNFGKGGSVTGMSNLPSNMLSMGSEQKQPYSWMGNNFLGGGQQNPYSWWQPK